MRIETTDSQIAIVKTSKKHMKTNMTAWMAQVISQRQAVALPIMTHPGIERNGHTVRQAVSDGTVHCKAVTTLNSLYDSVAAATIMDLTVEAEAFGASVVFSDIAVPAVTGRLVSSADDIARLQVPSLERGRIKAYLKADLLAAQAINDRPVLAGCIGPFSLAGRLYDLSDVMVLIYEQPDAAHLLLQKCTDFIAKYCQAIKATGANGVVMAEPASGLLSNDDCLLFSSQYVRQIVSRVQDDWFAVVLHNCGNTGHCTRAMVATGAAAYHFGNKCRMEEVISEVPPTALAMGNIDPVAVFKDGTPQLMKQTVTRLLDQMAGYPNFVLSSGCDTPPLTPQANIDAFFDALHEWNAQHRN